LSGQRRKSTATLTVSQTGIRLFVVEAPEAQQSCTIKYSNWSWGAATASALHSMVDG
jgi:endonuclease YncB( thermonuclease family)